jgi:uncharacterized protein (TIGR04255 family)
MIQRGALSRMTGQANSRTDLGPARPRHLRRAPISEALIDFRVQLPEGFRREQLEAAVRRVEVQYPVHQALRAFRARLDVDGALVKPGVEHSELGVLVKSADGQTQAQFRVNGFTLNRLGPYTSWEEIYPETKRLWRVYVDIAKPVAVVRLGTRYINRLRLPLPVADLRDYLVEPPKIPEGLPQTVHGFLSRLIIHDPARQHSAIVTQSWEQSPQDAEHATILLDIDAFKDVAVSTEKQDAIDAVLSDLRDFKNAIFFGSITQQASELFE